ncbi:Uncharacterised protein [Legionella sainthelensi]|uniref:hypothetical protein n=1 Tax=Legionella sainthelensi TaxID=28087 RepID=UPI000F6DFB43|nr:hypothetical protein [Legionella sainthelensi]VEB36358.1 Uncharacterised protein [Legionella sainthelensi]
MSLLTSRMMATFTPQDLFIDLYGSIMAEYNQKTHNAGAYDELAEIVERANEEGILSAIMRHEKTLYLFPVTATTQKDDFLLQLTNNSKQILQYEFKKWFGPKKVYDALMPQDQEITQILSQYFSYLFFVHHLSFANGRSNCLYLTITPGKKLTDWLMKIGKKDIKPLLNLIKNKHAVSYFDSITTIVVETSVTAKDEMNQFLKEHIDTLIKYEHIAWLGTLEIEDPQLQWPSNLKDLDVFNEWFQTEIYDDVVLLESI